MKADRYIQYDILMIIDGASAAIVVQLGTVLSALAPSSTTDPPFQQASGRSLQQRYYQY